MSGPFLDLVIELAQDELFIKLAPVPDRSVSLRKREEMVTRFFAYSDGYANGFDGYKDRPAEFLFGYSKAANETCKDKKKVTEYKRRFSETMKFVERTFPFGFRKTASATETRYTRFESLSVGSFLAITECPDLKKQVPDVSGWINGEKFKEYSKSGGANAKRRLCDRLEFVRNQLVGK